MYLINLFASKINVSSIVTPMDDNYVYDVTTESYAPA